MNLWYDELLFELPRIGKKLVRRLKPVAYCETSFYFEFFHISVKDKDWKHPTFGPVVKITAHQDDDKAIGLGRNIYLAATQASQRLLLQGIPDEEVNVAVHGVYDPNHSWFKELEMDDKLVTLADHAPKKFTTEAFEECRRQFMEENRTPTTLSNYGVDIDDF